jgi:hypothetical protein
MQVFLQKRGGMKLVKYPSFTLSRIADIFINRRFDTPQKIDKDIKIFVFQHFNVELPECFENRTVYIPILGGGKADDMLCDVSQPSIAEYNRYLNEMTQIYWVAKHYRQLGNPDYVGFAHYRRCLDWSPDLLAPGVLYASLTVTRYPIYRFFSMCHGDSWLKLFMVEFKRTFAGQGYDDIEMFWRSHCGYIANNFITDRESFYRYFLFAEKCLGICIKFLQNNIDEFQTMTNGRWRQFGFIMEQMTSYWIWHEKRQGRIKVITSRLKCYNINNGTTSVR